MNNYDILKELCKDNGTLRKYYYDLEMCYDKAIAMCYGEYLSGNVEHRHSNLYSVVFDYCKKHNLVDYVGVFVNLIETSDIKIGVTPKATLYNYEVYNKIPHYKESEEIDYE